MFLDFDKFVNLFQQHLVGGDTLWILENAEQDAFRSAVMVGERLESRIQAVDKFIAFGEDAFVYRFVCKNIGSLAPVSGPAGS